MTTLSSRTGPITLVEELLDVASAACNVAFQPEEPVPFSVAATAQANALGYVGGLQDVLHFLHNPVGQPEPAPFEDLLERGLSIRVDAAGNVVETPPSPLPFLRAFSASVRAELEAATDLDPRRRSEVGLELVFRDAYDAALDEVAHALRDPSV